MSVPWAPTTAQVAAYIPERTVTVSSPGVETAAGNFTTATTPTATQAATFIDEATDYVTGRVGTPDASLEATAGEAAAMRAAGLIELAYPTRDADLNTGDRWIKLADQKIASLAAQNSNPGTTGDPSALLPVYSFPDPPTYADLPL